jgi:hypothetical protein
MMDKLNPSTYTLSNIFSHTHMLTTFAEVDADGDGKAGFMN